MTDAPKKKAHYPLPWFPVVDDELQAGGRPISAWAREMGGRPFYIYDRRIVAERIASLREALPPALHLHYAIKCNPLPALVDFIAPLVDGLDVASARELETALGSGTAPDTISFAGPGKTDFELERAVSAGITLNVESPTELRRLEAVGERLGQRPRAAIRVNPDFELKASGMKMGGGPKPFGIDAEQVPAVLADMKSMDLEFIGFHIFSGSQNLRAESVTETQTKTFDLAYRLAGDAPSPLKSLNIGGGFGIPYFPGDTPLDLAAVAENLAPLVDEASKRLPGAELITELGRYIAGEAGLYVCSVVDRKVSRGTTYLVTDGGLHHHLALSGNFGQILRKNYPVAVATRVNGGPREVVNVVGPLCTPLDILADQMELAQAGPGDLIAVYQSGAYGYTASPRDFLSHPEPGEILV
ncbi:MAG: pyridoxal-dependent decarboxylase, exosortase A system-associated [Gammaproteobacteria bacterium]